MTMSRFLLDLLLYSAMLRAVLRVHPHLVVLLGAQIMQTKGN